MEGQGVFLSRITGALRSSPKRRKWAAHRQSMTTLLPGTTPNRCALFWSHGSSGSVLSGSQCRCENWAAGRETSQSVAGLALLCVKPGQRARCPRRPREPCKETGLGAAD